MSTGFTANYVIEVKQAPEISQTLQSLTEILVPTKKRRLKKLSALEPTPDENLPPNDTPMATLTPSIVPDTNLSTTLAPSTLVPSQFHDVDPKDVPRDCKSLHDE